MPQIYSPEKRDEIRERLIERARELIKHRGMKRMRIEELTQSVGIAQGTFYNFFKSKEILVCEMINDYQKKQLSEVDAIVNTEGYLSREHVRQLYTKMFLEDEENILRFISREDIQTLLTRLPSGYVPSFETVKETIKIVLDHASNRRLTCDISQIINWIQVLNLVVENKDLLAPSAFESTVGKLIEQLLDEIYEKGGHYD